MVETDQQGTTQSPASFSSAVSFRRSTKYTDTESGWLNYTYRVYDASTGRWRSREPLEEAGSLALYGFVNNQPHDLIDYLGLLGLRGEGGNPVQIGPGIPYGPASPFDYNPWDPTGESHQQLDQAVGLVFVNIRIAGDAIGGGLLLFAPDPTLATKVGAGLLYADIIDTLKAAFTGKGYYQAALENQYGEGAPGIETALLVKDLSIATVGLASMTPRTATVSDIPRVVGNLVKNKPCAVEVTVQPVQLGQGTVPNLDALSRAALVPDRGGLTAAGRSLTKHGAGARPGNSLFPPARGNPSIINGTAQNIVDDILTTPGSTFQNGYKGRFGNTIEVTAPDGRGMFYDANGKFLYFKERR